jgi:hypothetical protein
MVCLEQRIGEPSNPHCDWAVVSYFAEREGEKEGERKTERRERDRETEDPLLKLTEIRIHPRSHSCVQRS